MRSPADAQIELLRRADRGANEDGCVGWIGQRNICQLVHAHSRGNGYCRHFRDVHRALADDVTAQYFARLALDDRLVSRSCIAGAVPRYGICCMLMPVIILHSSPATWLEFPVPAEAMLSLPGLALA